MYCVFMSDAEFNPPQPPEISFPEKPSTAPRELLYSGFSIPIQEIIADDPKTIADINKVNSSLDTEHFSDTSTDETLEETAEWLNEVSSPFDITDFAEESVVIVPKTADEKTSYAYFTPSEEVDRLPAKLRKQHAKAALDLSYVTAANEESLDPEEIAKFLIQSNTALLERSLGRRYEDFNGKVTTDEIALAKKKLSIFAAIKSEGEINSRKALELAGFQKVHDYIFEDDGQQYDILALIADSHFQKFAQHQSTSAS